MQTRLSKFPQGVVQIPPSKSVAHRAIICAALAGGGSTLTSIDLSEDITVTLACMTALGASFVSPAPGTYTLTGIQDTTNEPLTLDAGESGSTLRFLIPIAAALGKTVRFTGRGRLLQRPLTPYVSVLQENGANFTQTAEGVQVSGQLHSGVYHLPGEVSSQFVTGLLLALPLVAGGGEIVLTSPLESTPYVALTIEVMKQFGVTVEQDGFSSFRVDAHQRYLPNTFTVEADYSQAAFFLVAGALGCPAECVGLKDTSLQGDRRILDILAEVSAQVRTGPHGGLLVTAGKLTPIAPITIDVSDIPDLVPVLAVLLSFCEGESRLVNAARLRLKESDRLTAISTELNRLGANITVGEDFLQIVGVNSLTGGRVQTWGDHRIAMAMAVAAIKSDQPVLIEGSDCVNKSYPNFWADFQQGDKGGSQP